MFFLLCVLSAVAGSQLSENEDLRQELDDIIRTFDNLIRDLRDRTETNEGDIAQMLATFAALQEHITKVLKTGTLSDINEIVEVIKNREYDKVKIKIMKLNDNQVWRVVREVYSSSKANFDIIIELSDTIGGNPFGNKINWYLYQEMLINNHRDPSNLLTLLNSSVKFDDKELIQAIQNSLVNSLKEVTGDQIKLNAVKPKIYDIHNRIYNLDPTLFEKVSRQTIISVYNKVDTIKIIEYIEKYDIKQRKISAKLLYEIMNSNRNLALTEKTSITIYKLSQILKEIDFNQIFIESMSVNFDKNICLQLFQYNQNMFYGMFEKFLKLDYQRDKDAILEKILSLNNKDVINKTMEDLYNLVQNDKITDENVIFFLKYNSSVGEDIVRKLNLKQKLILELKDLKSEKMLRLINEFDHSLCISLMYEVIVETKFDETLEYIKKQKDLRLKMSIYNALLQHMEYKKDTILNKSTVLPILKLTKTVENMQINELDTKLKADKRLFLEKIPNFEEEIKEKFKSYILTLRNDDIIEIINIVYLHDHNIYKNIIDKLINEVYGTIKIDWILKNIFKLKYIEEYIIGCKIVFSHLEKNGDVAFKVKTVKDLLELTKSVDNISKMKNYKNINIYYKEELNKIKSRLPNIHKMAEEKLIHDLSFYNNITEIILITNQLAKDATNFITIMDHVFSRIYQIVDIKKIITFIKSTKYIEGMIECYRSVFKLIENSRNFHDFINVGFALKELIGGSNFKKVKPQYNEKIDFLKFKLPVSIRNLIFSEKVCLKNVIRREFLIVENDHYKFDKHRRSVFTSISKGINVKSYFNIIKNNEKFLLKNSHYEEYLYASLRYYETGYTRRMVFSDVDKSYRNESFWIIEPYGDNCYIKSVKYNEYLYAPVDRYRRDDAHRWIFTFVPQTKDSSSLWKIVDCSDF